MFFLVDNPPPPFVAATLQIDTDVSYALELTNESVNNLSGDLENLYDKVLSLEGMIYDLQRDLQELQGPNEQL